ncbi:MAG: hypothetical protein KAS22_12525 [Candidatus Heimdallarchaeota archaeon]|nr:hypothetical protein [Candidatus Heimdallarchaeota archaeon]
MNDITTISQFLFLLYIFEIILYFLSYIRELPNQSRSIFLRNR